MRSDKHKSGVRPKEGGKHDRKDDNRAQREAAAKHAHDESESGDPRVRRRDEKTGQTLH